MVVEYFNRKGQKYYLHQGTTKTGKPKYFFSMKSKGTLVQTIPDGFEIYENPNAQVFLQKLQPQIITPDEIATVDKEIKKFSYLLLYPNYTHPFHSPNRQMYKVFLLAQYRIHRCYDLFSMMILSGYLSPKGFVF